MVPSLRMESTNLHSLQSDKSDSDLRNSLSELELGNLFSSVSDDVAISEATEKSTENEIQELPTEEQIQNSSDVSQSVEEQNVVTIDISRPIQLVQNSIIVVNGQKCVLQHNPSSGEVIAYPVKEPETEKKKKGRPKNSKSKKVVVTTEVIEDCFEEPEHKGIGTVEVPTEDGLLIKRSCRRRKKATFLRDYETGNIRNELDGPDEENDLEEEESEISQISRRKRKKFFHRTDPPSLFPFLQASQKKRGRPRRHNGENMQGFLIRTNDGQELMMQIPSQDLPKNVSLEEIAQNIATSLNQVTGDAKNKLEIPTASNENSISTLSFDQHPQHLIDQPIEQSAIDLLKPTVQELHRESLDSAILMSSNEEPIVDENTIDRSNSESSVQAGVINTEAEIPVFPKDLSDLLIQRGLSCRSIKLNPKKEFLDTVRCAKCQHQSYSQQQHEEHLLSHSDATKCKICSVITFSSEEITLHYKAQHPKHICIHCDYRADHPYLVKRHMQTHEKRVQASCPTCNKLFRDENSLRVHIRVIHSHPLEMFQCGNCSKTFTRKYHLTRHLKIHEQIKRYKCQNCDYRANEKADIQKHMISHGELKHFCEICQKGFHLLKNKILHVKRHKGEKDYQCGVCDFYGYTFTDIKNHIQRRHSDSNTLFCQLCKQMFRNKAVLDKHQENGDCEGYAELNLNEETEVEPEGQSDEEEEIDNNEKDTTKINSDGTLELPFVEVPNINNHSSVTVDNNCILLEEPQQAGDMEQITIYTATCNESNDENQVTIFSGETQDCEVPSASGISQQMAVITSDGLLLVMNSGDAQTIC